MKKNEKAKFEMQKVGTALTTQDILRKSFLANQIEMQKVGAAIAMQAISEQSRLFKQFEDIQNSGVIAAMQTTLEYRDRYNFQLDIIRQASKNMVSYIAEIRNSAVDFFKYEDVYGQIYDNIYRESLNINNNKVCVSENGVLEISDENEVSSQYPLANQKDVAELPMLFKSITKELAIKFVSHIVEYPYLAFQDEVGVLIFDEIKRMSAESLLVIPKNTKLYRAKLWDEKRTFDYVLLEMWQAPHGIPEIGRFNPHGISYLYMTESEDVAREELKTRGKCTILEAQIKNAVHVLDMTKNKCTIFDLCNKRKSTSTVLPSEYLLPNYIAQCCNYLDSFGIVKIDGLKYESTLVGGKMCYVFFKKFRDSFCNERLITE